MCHNAAMRTPSELREEFEREGNVLATAEEMEGLGIFIPGMSEHARYSMRDHEVVYITPDDAA